MQLNLQKRKNFSEDNMRRIINLIIGISSQTSQLQDQCLTDYDETRVYSAGNITIYDGYIWEAKTVATGTWDSSKWTKIGTDEFTEIDLDTVKSWLNLSQEEIANLQSLIDDTVITTTKTNSSSKIYMDIQAAIAECKNDTLKQIAKKVSGSYKIAASTSDVTSADFIYLINNGVNYDLYVLVDSVPTRVGDTTVNLDNYYTKTEIDSDFLKKTDAASTYATITTVDGKVDKTNIINNLTSTDTDKPLSANQGKVLKDEVDLKANDTDLTTHTGDINIHITTAERTKWNEVDNKVNNTDLNNLSQGILVSETETSMNENILLWDVGHYYFNSNIAWEKYKNIPSTEYAPHIYVTSVKPTKYKDINLNSAEKETWFRQIKVDGHLGESFIRTIYTPDINDVINLENGKLLSSGSDTGWQRLCTTSVADVPKTIIPCKDVTNFPGIDSGECTYYVRNGICYVSLWGISTTTVENDKAIPGAVLPKTANGSIGTFLTAENSVTPTIFAYVQPTGQLTLNVGEANIRCYGSFSYPVAES